MSSPTNGTLNGNADVEKRDPSEIKPVIPQSFIKKFVRRLYGMEVIDFTELNSYDDRNYHIHVDTDINNTYIETINPSGYVLKVLNSGDSKDPAIIGKVLFNNFASSVQIHLTRSIFFYWLHACLCPR